MQAVCDGIILEKGYSVSYGYYVKYGSHSGDFVFMYAHLSKITAKNNGLIQKGQILALSGDTGMTTGPHLHYEITYKGEKIDPILFTDLEISDFLGTVK